MNNEESLLDEENYVACYHEAGHAVAAWKFGFALDFIEMWPNGGGATHFIPGSRMGLKPNSTIDDPKVQRAIIVSFMGAASETRARIDRSGQLIWNTDGLRTDALELMAKLLWFSDWKRPHSRYSLEKFYEDFGGASRALVWDPAIWGCISALAEVLIEKGRLSGQEAVQLILTSWPENRAFPEKALPASEHGNGENQMNEGGKRDAKTTAIF